MHALDLSVANIVLVFLAATVAAAVLGGRGASITTSVLAVLAFNFFFVEPRFTFVVSDLQFLLTFGVLLGSGIFVSELVGRLGQQAQAARTEAEANRLLYRFGRALSSTTGTRQVADRARHEIESWLRTDVSIRLVGSAAAEGPVGHRVPLLATTGDPLGVLVVPNGEGLDRRTRQLLASVAGQVALALEREALARAASEAALRAESERTRADLLATVSHDLRTPLATIHGATAAVLRERSRLTEAEIASLLEDVLGETDRLARIIENLLQLGRVEAGLRPSRQRFPVDELVSSALDRLRGTAGQERIRATFAEDLPLVDVDGDLLVQLLWNLFENALRYAPEGPIELTARPRGDGVEILVADRGPGFPPGDPARLFQRYVREERPGARSGCGLGLAICRAIATLHGASLAAERREGGGACFRLVLPRPPTAEELAPRGLAGVRPGDDPD